MPHVAASYDGHMMVELGQDQWNLAQRIHEGNLKLRLILKQELKVHCDCNLTAIGSIETCE